MEEPHCLNYKTASNEREKEECKTEMKVARGWTVQEDIVLLTEYLEGRKWRQLAHAELDRTVKALERRLEHLTEKCSKLFRSDSQ